MYVTVELKKNVFILLMLKFFNNHLTNSFNIIKDERFTSLTKKVERKFV